MIDGTIIVRTRSGAILFSMSRSGRSVWVVSSWLFRFVGKVRRRYPVATIDLHLSLHRNPR